MAKKASSKKTKKPNLLKGKIFYMWKQLNKWLKKHHKSILMAVNIGTLIAFIGASTCQYNITREALGNDTIMRVKDTLARDRYTKIELRAYMGVSFIAGIPPSVTRQFEVKFFEVNKGKTPARIISLPGEWCIGSKTLAQIAERMKNPSILDRKEYVQMQETNDTLLSSLNLNLTHQQIDNIYNGTDTFFFFLQINYLDIFGEEHFTRACYFFDTRGADKRLYTRYKQYNDAN